MKLSAKFLKNVANINCFEHTDQWDMAEGSAQTLYFQIVDSHKEDLRYITGATTYSVDVTFLSIDTGLEFTKAATQNFADDKSVWSIALTAAEVPTSGAVKFKLTEDAVESQFRVEAAIVVHLLGSGSC